MRGEDDGEYPNRKKAKCPDDRMNLGPKASTRVAPPSRKGMYAPLLAGMTPHRYVTEGAEFTAGKRVRICRPVLLTL